VRKETGKPDSDEGTVHRNERPRLPELGDVLGIGENMKLRNKAILVVLALVPIGSYLDVLVWGYKYPFIRFLFYSSVERKRKKP
jgi:hypothetical protein